MQIRMKPGALAEYLTDQGISRDELARRMEVSTSTAYRVDSGELPPSATFIAKLLAVTGRKFDDMFVTEKTDQVKA